MRLSNTRSITGKLARLVIVAVGAATLIIAVIGIWQEAGRALAAKRETLLATAHAFAAASGNAVASHDAVGTSRALRGIAGIADVTFAAVEDASGLLLAEIGSGARLAGDLELTASGSSPDPFKMLFTHSVEVTAPIQQAGRQVGRLRLVGQLVDLQDRLMGVLLGAGCSGMAALAAGLAISLRLQRSITGPLLALTQGIRTIQASHNYALRVEVRTDDETSILAASFNTMLGKVRERDLQLVAHRDRLEQDVAERTRDLALATASAEAANAAKSAFLATMSHEIRTPMNGMLVMAELLVASDLPQRQRRYAEVIARSGKSLVAIINDILDFSKIEAGKLSLESIRFSPADIVDTVVTLFAERAAEKGLDLAGVVAPEVPATVEGDPVRVTQVLGNLVNNALKFTHGGHVLITVTPGPAAGTLHYAVADTGIGIAADKLGSIFEAFSQADGSTTRHFGGTGLGLSICARLADAMGGRIAVESREGAGSVFTFSLQVGTDGRTSPAPTADPPRPVRVLLDGDATRQAVSAGLAAAGFKACEDASERHDLIVDAHVLAAWGNRGGADRVVGVAAIGDLAGADALSRGLADGLLRRPLVQSEWRSVLDRLRDGRAFESDNVVVAAVPSEPVSQFSGLRVLVADDSAVNREVAREALDRLGACAEIVEDGYAALEAAASGRFGLVLMDGSMPGLDGYEATRRLRQEERRSGRPPVPVVALTAHVIGTAADAWRDAGMDGVLHKPFSMAQLAACLRQHHRGDGLPGTASGAPAAAAAAISNDLLDSETLDGLAAMAGASPDGGFLRRILGLFVDAAPHAMAELAAATEGAEAAAAAHKLRSMGLNVGAAQLAERLETIESAARDHRALPALDDLASVRRLLESSIAALEKWAATGEPDASQVACVSQSRLARDQERRAASAAR